MLAQRWLVTGAAGFIGSHLLEELLKRGETVVGLDNFATGKRDNLADVRQCVGETAWGRFRFVEGDIRNLSDIEAAIQGCDIVLHQAALGSVPRSLVDPVTTNSVNVAGFLNTLVAAKAAAVKRFVYASSSSVYGDSPKLPKREDETGKPLSPYAVSKATNELYADTFARNFGMELVGLRYFNVFGPRQDPEGAYAAVIPRWIGELLRGQPIEIFGDGETSRDFCFVANVVEANIRAALTPLASKPAHQVLNVACGDRTTLKQLFQMIHGELVKLTQLSDAVAKPSFKAERAGDVRHSLADISRLCEWSGWTPPIKIAQGLSETMGWYVNRWTGGRR